MRLSTLSIVRRLRDVADMAELADPDGFQARLFRRAADWLAILPQGLPQMLAEGFDLTGLPGVGPGMAANILGLMAGGACRATEELGRSVPLRALSLRFVEGIGPRRARALWQGLRLTCPEELLAAAQAGKVRELRGFGPRLEEQLGEAVARFLAGRPGVFLAEAEEYAAPLVDALAALPGAGRVVQAGAARRRCDAIDALELLVEADDPRILGLAAPPPGGALLERAGDMLALRLINGMRVEVRAVPAARFGAALVWHTAAPAHREALRRLAGERGWTLDERGLHADSETLARDEDGIYAALGLPPISPELREGLGGAHDEIAAAQGGRLPRLVALEDIRADLHSHTTWTDGSATLEDMALAARLRGYACLGISDHSARPGTRFGLSAEQLAGQWQAIDALNARREPGAPVLLRGCEVEILADGSLGLPDEALRRLDYALCSVHTGFDLARPEQTARVLRAVGHPACAILGHPTARALGMFPALELDMAAVIGAAARAGIALELDCKRDRMDLSADHCRSAKTAGVPVCINTDAHSLGGLAAMPYGVAQARRGWLEKSDVLNTCEDGELRRVVRPYGRKIS